MSGSFRARDGLQRHKGNSHRQKEKTTLISCLHKVIALLNASVDGDVFFPGCVCQKIRDICWQIKNAYRGEAVPVLVTNGQSPEELIKAVKSRIASDGTIGGAARAEIIEGLNAVLVMING